MRDDHKLALKKVKQQINAFCLRHGQHYAQTKWTVAHLKWLKKLEISVLYREVLDEYMASYEEYEAKIERFDQRIEELASHDRYAEWLAPGEDSCGPKTNRIGLSKAGNGHLRKLLIESSGGICKGMVGHKSKELKARQNGNSAEVIAYADRANTRLRSRYYNFCFVYGRGVLIGMIEKSGK